MRSAAMRSPPFHVTASMPSRTCPTSCKAWAGLAKGRPATASRVAFSLARCERPGGMRAGKSSVKRWYASIPADLPLSDPAEVHDRVFHAF